MTADCAACTSTAMGGRIRIGTRSQALWLRGTIRANRGMIVANRALVKEADYSTQMPGQQERDLEVWDFRLREIDQLISDLDRVIDEKGWHADGQPQRAHS